MNGKRMDLRKRMTYAMIRQCIIEMLKNQSIQEISVTELCAKAGINRSTFYSHYEDIYDLKKTIEDEFFGEFIQTLSHVTVLSLPSENETPPFMTAIYEFLKKNSDVCQILLSNSSERYFVDHLFENARKKAIVQYSDAFPLANEEKINQFYSFCAFGCIGLIGKWINSGLRETPEQMAANANALIMNCSGFLMG